MSIFEICLTTITTITIAVFGSNGMWNLINNRSSKKNANNKMIIGLAHDRLMFLATKYIERGYISKDEYNSLHQHLYIPYKELGGNGMIDKLIEEVNKLPIKYVPYSK